MKSLSRGRYFLTGINIAVILALIVFASFALPATLSTIFGAFVFVVTVLARIAILAWIGVTVFEAIYAATEDYRWRDIVDQHEKDLARTEERKKAKVEARMQKREQKKQQKLQLEHKEQEVLNVSGLQGRWADIVEKVTVPK